MNTTQLAEYLKTIQGAKPVTFKATTIPEIRKLPPFPQPITKTQIVNGFVNFYYDQGVINRLIKEGKDTNFRKGTSWHHPVIINDRLTPLCQSKTNPDKYYLRFMLVQPITNPTYHDANGNQVDLSPYLRIRNPYENQGLEFPLVFLTYDLNNIQEITINGKTLLTTA